MYFTYKRVALIAVFFCVVGVSFAQKWRANIFYKEKRYRKATELYQEYLDKGKTKNLSAIKGRMANAYYKLRDFRSAEPYFEWLVDNRPSPKIIMQYARVLEANGNYDKAERYFKQFREQYGDSAQVQMELVHLDSMKNWKNNEPFFKVKKLSDKVNTDLDEFSFIPYDSSFVLVSEEEKSFFYHSFRSRATFYSIFKTEGKLSYNSQELKEPIVWGVPLNKDVMNGPVAFSDDYKEAFVTVVNNERKLGKPLQNKPQLYYTKLQGGEWNELQKLPFNKKEVNFAHASISSDGQTLYFSSTMEGGVGQADLYKVTRNGDTWGSPQNLGKQINTIGSELFPYVDKEGTLYFASDGHAGYGGLDIFRAEKSADGYTITNLLKPLNSSADDFAFNLISDSLASFSSNRKHKKGNDDVFLARMLPREEPKKERTKSYFVEVSVVEKLEEGYQALTDVDVEVKNSKGKKVTELHFSEKEAKDLNLETGEVYTFIARKHDYFTTRKNLNTNPDAVRVTSFQIVMEEETEKDTANETEKPSEKEAKKKPKKKVEVEMDKMDYAKQYSVPNVYYPFDKTSILPRSRSTLDSLVTLLKDNPGLKIRLESHADERGTPAYNMDLSQRRAETVVDFLVKNGISRQRLKAKGYGESRPKVDDAETEAEHQKNRRTEFTILEKGQNGN